MRKPSEKGNPDAHKLYPELICHAPWTLGWVEEQNYAGGPWYKVPIHVGPSTSYGNCFMSVGLGGKGAINGTRQAVEATAAYIISLPKRVEELEAELHQLRTAATTAQGGWISVEERLPERVGNMWYSEYVLLHLGFHKLPVIGYYDYREGYGCFKSKDKDEELPAATHWHPLPQPPIA